MRRNAAETNCLTVGVASYYMTTYHIANDIGGYFILAADGRRYVHIMGRGGRSYRNGAFIHTHAQTLEGTNAVCGSQCTIVKWFRKCMSI